MLQAIGIALVPALGLSLFFLFDGLVHEHHYSWPLYVFVGVIAVGTVAWGYLASKSLK
jgi:hypothetical protein